MKDDRFRIQEDMLVIGNQAADLDSSVSAFALSELLSRKNPEISCHPLIQGSPYDLKLKPEISALFQRAEISLKPDNFSEIFFKKIADNENPERKKPETVIMVDHNVPDSREITHRIGGIVDHHTDASRYQDLSFRDIRHCGSCASIISEYWHEEMKEIPYGISLLLAGAIAVDTGYLDPAWGKTTDLDRRESTRINTILKDEDRLFIRTLLKIKNDLSHLNIQDQLRRDYKKFPLDNLNAGIASVPMGQRDFFRKDFFNRDEIIKFKDQYCSDLLIIMHTIPEPFSRELSVYTDNYELLTTVKTALSRLKSADFISADLATADPENSRNRFSGKWALYTQNNIKISRKGFVPLLKEELENLMTSFRRHNEP